MIPKGRMGIEKQEGKHKKNNKESPIPERKYILPSPSCISIGRLGGINNLRYSDQNRTGSVKRRNNLEEGAYY